MAWPWMMTCARVSVFGLSSTGFMSVCGASPAACACSACARPISPPSTVTAELSAMFCGLNGATLHAAALEHAAQRGDQRRSCRRPRWCLGPSGSGRTWAYPNRKRERIIALASACRVA